MNFIELANLRLDEKKQSFIKGGNTGAGASCQGKCHGDNNVMANKLLANMRENNDFQQQMR